MRQANAQLAANAAILIDLAPSLAAFDAIPFGDQHDAINRTDLQARFATSTMIDIDDGDRRWSA